MSSEKVLTGGSTWSPYEAKVLNVHVDHVGMASIEFRYPAVGYVGWRPLAHHPTFPTGTGLMVQIAVAATISGRSVQLDLSDEVNPEGHSEIMAILFWPGSAQDAGPIRPFGADASEAPEAGDPRAHGRLA